MDHLDQQFDVHDEDLDASVRERLARKSTRRTGWPVSGFEGEVGLRVSARRCSLDWSELSVACGPLPPRPER